jgi:alpha-galactosidase
MGWNSWNTFGAKITEADVRETADAIVESGLAAKGYEYVVIDDFWEADERVDGRLTWNRETFPGGIPALAEYVHGKGLKFGIYSCAGTKTCGGKPASFHYEETDAATFAEWGVDYLKYDFCFHPNGVDAMTSYARMGRALRSSGRDIVFSQCCWGHDECWTWARWTGGQLWRTTGDISDDWESIRSIGFEKQRELWPYAGPSGWNDSDMLVVGMRGKGNPEVVRRSDDVGCTDLEYQTHFALWCLQAAPLMMGCDVRSVDGEALAILSNEALIAVNQDPLGAQARPIGSHRNIDIWVKPLADGSVAVGFFHLGERAGGGTSVAWGSLGLPEVADCRVTELVSGEDRGVRSRYYDCGRLEPHGCEVVRIAPVG